MSSDSVDFSVVSHSYADALRKGQNTHFPDLSHVQLMEIYSQWKDTYDRDAMLIGYHCPQQLAQRLEQLVTCKKSKILDIGAGTGFLGVELQKVGFINIDAIDPSKDMLDKAMKLGLYKRVIMDYVDSHRLDIPDDTYDVITGAGIFVPGHANGECLEELLRLAKPGGLIIIVCCEQYYGKENHFYGDLLDKRILELINRGRWEQQSRDCTIMYRKGFNAYVTVLKKN